MKRYQAVAIAALLGARAAYSQSNSSPAVLIQQADPDYGQDAHKPFVADAIRLEVIIDDKGIPISVDSPEGIPDSVVQALSQLRFRPVVKDGRPVAAKLALRIPVRRFADYLPKMLIQHLWTPSRETADLVANGSKLDAAQAAGMEQGLKTDPNPISTQTKLLSYAANHPSEETRALRARQIGGLAQSTPQAEILGSPIAFINAADGPLADANTYAEVRQIWLDHLSMTPDDPKILENAFVFLRVGDPERVEPALLSARGKVREAGAWLGEVYAFAAIGVTGLDVISGAPVTAGARLPETGFGQKARATLNSVSDLQVLTAAMTATRSAGIALSRAGQLPDGFQAYCDALLTHTREFNSNIKASCNVSSSAPTASVPAYIDSRVHEGGAIKKEPPVYPAAAKAQHIEGSIRFDAVINKQGTIQTLELRSGPLVFYDSARTAVSKWEYKPYRLNGEAVDVITEITVNFVMR